MDNQIPPYNSYIITLEGRNFSSLLSGFNKPVDKNFIQTMCMVASDLLKRFKPNTVFTSHNQILLVFNKTCTIEQFESLKETSSKTRIKSHIYDGDIIQISSLVSAYCSVRFNYHLSSLMLSEADNYDTQFIEYINDFEQIFQPKIKTFIDDSTLFTYFNFAVDLLSTRVIYDYADHYLGDYVGKNIQDIIQMLSFVDIDINSIPQFIIKGFYCKRIISTEPNKIFNNIFKSFDFDQANKTFLIEDVWENSENSIEVQYLDF